MGVLTVGQVAREISQECGSKVRSRVISDAFYGGHLREDLCPVQCGRRLIPATYVPEIKCCLKRLGKIR